MDLNEHELAELEERLYSSIHHAESESTNVTPASETAVEPPNPGVPAAGPSSLRIVTNKSIINNAPRQTVSSKIKRYWDSLQQQKMSYPGISKPKRIAGPAEGKANESVESGSAPAIRIFTPYQSILGSMNGGGSVKDNDGSLPAAEGPSEEKQRKKKTSQPDGKRRCNPSETRNRKMEQLKKLKGKKAKALKNRQKASEQRLVATIDLDSSSEEEGEYRSPDPIKQEKKEIDDQRQELEDSDPDEVVLIPTAPPPLVCIVDSEDELAKDGFTHPKSKKKKQTKKVNSPRCVSPSNSSIMSDDFIGQSDRTRLADSFLEGITNDEELDCTAPHTVGSLLAGERRGFGDLSRQARAPSISSDCTVATSSDTTDPDKRNGVKQNASVPLAGQSLGGPKVCSTPKQTLTVKKSAGSKTSKASEDDSIYAATSAKKSKPSTERAPSSDSSNESEEGNVSSHSKRSKSYQSDTGSTKSLVKRRKKRRKQESEHYSDEDFASMLTDIVQAISENEDESSDEETTVEAVLKDSQEIVETQPSKSMEESAADHSNDVQEVEVEEPQNQISLPQVEPRMETSAPVVIPDESNDSSAVLAIGTARPLPPINLVDDNVFDRPQEQENEEEVIRFRRVNDDPECCWNDEVRKFYNESWNCEDFNISTVLFNMPRSNKYWPIVHKDKYPDPPKKEIICNNCGERGHMRYKCRNPPKPKTCYMCGLEGHQEVRCPNTLCLKCGEKTKNFLRGCPSCAREQNMTCHMCGVRGHGQRNCPDKWRRYHSTVEDNKTLTQQFVRNPNAKHCCICSRAGHQAHTCNAALKIFGQLVPTTEVKNYQQVYQFNKRCREENHGPKFNQFSDMTDYRLNFDESFAANENSFYYRFAKSVGIVEEKKRKEEKMARKLKRATKKQKTGTEGTQSEPVLIDDDSMKADDQPNSSTAAVTPHGKAGNEDSNYSFSEFFEDKAPNLPQSSDHLPDYIPLVSSEPTVVVPASVEPLRTDAKIFLTKPHAKILLGPVGATFLKDASSKFALKVSISFQSMGNVLLANGLSVDQDNFHNELVKFLNDASHQNEQLKLINNVPKATEKTIRYITEHLSLLTRSYENAKILFKRYQHFEEQGSNAKTCDKIRRTLNIILFGQYGMRAGREHLTKLQSNLKNLQNTQELNVSVDFRDEINQHIRYIFTSFDHSNYEDILNEYEQLRKTKKIQKIKPEDLNLPPLAPIKGSDTSGENFAEDTFSEFKDLNFAERNTAIDFLSSLDEDLILNTSDQLIDPRKTPTDDSDEQSDSDQSSSDSPPPAASSLPNPTPKVKQHRSKKLMVDTLLEECSHMVRMLNSEPMTGRFERICSQTRQGHLSKANYRTLRGIHSVLKAKFSSIPHTNFDARSKPRPPWWSREAAAAVKARRKALRAFKKLPANHPSKEAALATYKEKNYECRHIINSAKFKLEPQPG